MSDATDRNHNPEGENDIVARALAALHGEQAPSGPSDEVMARTLRNLTRRDENERPNLFMRMMTMTFTQRLAAAVMLTLGGLTVWFMLALFGTFASVGYADVARQIKEARSMTFTMTMVAPQDPKPMTLKFFALEPGMLRHEDARGMVTVMRREGERVRLLLLEPTTKTAHLVQASLKEAAQGNPDFVAAFRGLADKPGEPLEDRQIGDVKAKGFRVVAEGQTVSLWAHPKTGLPLLVEMPIPAGEAGVGAKVVLSDIAFDEKLDEKLFSLDVPEGYKLNERKVEVTMDLEANVINLLRAYTKATGGVFPDKLDDWAAYGKAITSGKEQVDEAAFRALSGAGTITALLSSRKSGVDYAYAGKDVKLGEQGTIVFWHRDPAKGTYRAVYADLAAKDVSAEQVMKLR